MAKGFKRKISLILVALIIFTSAGGAFARPSDVSGSWAAGTIEKWYGLGLISGTSGNTFSPDSYTTKAELATYLVKLFNFTETSKDQWVDVPASAWYRQYIQKAEAAGIIEAKDGKVEPLRQITRQEAAQMIMSAFGWKKSESDNLKGFKDAKDIDAAYREAVNVLVEKGCLSGRVGLKIAPKDKATRAEVLVMLDQAAGELISKKGVYSQEVKGNLVVNTRDVTLKDMTVKGDLYLTRGIGDGEIVLDGVTVNGDTIVSGGGMKSIKIKNSSLKGTLLVLKIDGKVRIVAEGSSAIGNVELASGAKLQESEVSGSGFGSVRVIGVVEAGQNITLEGDFEALSIAGDNAGIALLSGSVKNIEVEKNTKGTSLQLDGGTVETLKADAGIKVTGKGTINSAKINSPGVSIEQKPGKVEISSGLTAMVGGSSVAGSVNSGGGSGSSPNTNNPPPNNPPATPGILFDDFNYASSSDAAIGQMGWTVKHTNTEGPGPAGCTWSRDNVTFIDDPENAGNKLVRFTSYTDGTDAGTNQAEIFTQRKFYEGTYAARVKFNDVPAEGPSKDGDAVVQTFFTITPLDYDLDPKYSECDFEYLPNGGWGDTQAFYETTWETYCNDPWIAVRDFSVQRQSYDGWHDLVLTVRDGHARYYIDGTMVADHSNQNYPEGPMSINFNQWFIGGGFNPELTGTRTYHEDIDWVYFAEDTVLTTDEVKTRVAGFRTNSVKSTDGVAAKQLENTPDAAALSVDNPLNQGSYAVTVTVPANNSAKALRLYEGTNLVLAREVTPNKPSAQSIVYNVTGKAISVYTYNAELSNANGTTTGPALTVEVEPGNAPFNAALGKPSYGSEGPLALSQTAINDGIISDSETAISGVGEGLQWAQIDFGRSYDVNKIKLWHYYADGRNYHDVIVRLSNTEDFSSGVTTVFNNDGDNSANLGIGGDAEYAETAEGKTIHFNTVNARYVRLYTNGLSKPMTDPSNPGQYLPYNHYVEVEVWTAGGDPGAALLSADSSNNTGDYTVSLALPALTEAANLTLYENDQVIIDEMELAANTEPQTITRNMSGKAVGSYTYRAVLTDGAGARTSAELVVTVREANTSPAPGSIHVDNAFNDGNYRITVTVPADNSAASVQLYENNTAFGPARNVTANNAEAQTVEYVFAGKPSGRYVYKAELENDSGTAPTQQITVKALAPVVDGVRADVALFKSVSGSAVDSSNAENALLMTDGDLETFAGPGEDLQWVQIDFGQSYTVDTVKLWHYFLDGRTYHDVVVQLSDDPAFQAGVTTVYNNDTDNSAGLGTGTNSEYAESAGGRTIEFQAVSARYVRLYSNGSTGGYPPANHYAAVEVWTVGD